jgi:hypothetical protein
MKIGYGSLTGLFLVVLMAGLVLLLPSETRSSQAAAPLRQEVNPPTRTAWPTAPATPEPGSLPLCDFHDPDQWHALISEDGSCHYDHEHKHDPNEVNDIFGKPGAWYGSSSSISFPWETSMENMHKHQAYSWIVRRDIPPRPGEKVWTAAFRVQAHVDATPFQMPDGSWSGGYLGRQHSYSVEALRCRVSDGACGIVRFGGWLNYGDLEIDGVTECVPLPNLAPDCPHGPGGRRIHFDFGGTAPKLPRRSAFFWYGEPAPDGGGGSPELLHPVVIAFATADAWNEVSLDTLYDPLAATFCPEGDCELNGSTIQQHVLQFNVPARLDRSGDGLVTFSGYTDRYGVLADGCEEVTLDCVPVQFRGAPVGRHQYRDDYYGIPISGTEDFDTSPKGEHWIEFPE